MPSSAKEYKKKLHGWLSYAFASEVFVVVSLTLFLPICLEQFARDNGFLLPDRTHPCSSLKVPITNTTEAALVQEEARCVVKIGWAWIDSASFSLYIYSISVALQAITVISMGGIADHPSHRKQLLLCFAALGSIAATIFLFLPSSSPVWYLSALLAISANVGFGASVVAMNAYIPFLAQESPEVVQILDKLQTFEGGPSTVELEDPDVTVDNESAPLFSQGDSSAAQENGEETNKKLLEAEYQTVLSRATSRISSFGIAIGYGAGICLLIIALIPVTQLHGSTFSLRLAIGLSGIWWAGFTIPAAVWLPGSRSAYGRGVHLTADGSCDDNGIPAQVDKEWNLWKEIIVAWIRLGEMLRWKEIKKLRNTFKYLAAWFLLSDGFTTITSTAILFGKTALHMSPSALILVGVLTPTSGILGSLAWPFLQRRFAWTNLQVLILLVIMASMIPAYGCLGFFFQGRTKFGGLTTQEEMFGLAVYFGSVYGAFQGYARAFYAELLPPGEEARWYGLFSITDKSSSFIGPLVVGVISDLTGNIRYAFFFLVFMVWLAVPILMSVNVEQGRKDAQAYHHHSISSNVR